MAGKADKMKGHVKEAVGEAFDNPELKRAGKKDKVRGSLKDKVNKAINKADEAVDKVAHSRKRTVNRDNM